MPAAPTVADVIATFEKAAELQNNLPLRKGNVVEIGPEAADEVLVSADLHGHCENYAAVLKQANLDAHPRRHLIMQEVCHGGPTYDDGGCMSHRMLEDVARQVVRYPGRVHYLLSNHELAELTDYPIMKSRRMLNVVFRMGLVNAYGPEADRVREAAMNFIRSCPLAIRIGRDVFVSHSLPEMLDVDPLDMSVFDRPLRPSDLMEQGPAFRIVWGRDFRLQNAAEYARMVHARLLLHGHEPCPEGHREPNELQIILDCCCEQPCCAIVPTNGHVDQGTVLKRLVKL